MKRLAVLLLLAGATPVFAQAASKAAPNKSPITSANRFWHGEVQGYLIRAAEALPEESYGFQPTPEVRTFGQIVGHVANAQYMFCATALKEASPAKQNYEKVTAKADLVTALKASAAYCARAYETVTDAMAAEPVKLFGQDANRASALIVNTAHDNEHYGNIVTYMRLKGLVPPSSQPQSN